jgi:hypothetical protein
MIVLDTNVVSEAMKPEPHLAVRTWLNDQAAETLYLGFYAQTDGNFRQLINRQFQPRWHPSQSGAACLGLYAQPREIFMGSKSPPPKLPPNQSDCACP